MRPLWLGLGVAVLLVMAGSVGAATSGPTQMSVAQSDYIENCGGCHGFDGNSAPADVPVLKNRIGYFLCTKEGRGYLIRVPNVAKSKISNSQELANLMNFVVFGLGAGSAPKNAKPFQAAEVARLRKQALTTVSLIDARARVVAELPENCNAPASLNKYYPGQPGLNHIDVPTAIH